MNKRSSKDYMHDMSPINAPSPISFASRAYSPGLIKSINALPPRVRQYKSPNSTPTTSPIPSKIVSIDEFSQCFSEKKNVRAKDSMNYLQTKLQIQQKKIQLLEEENKKLSLLKVPENWEKELIKRNDDMRKLENQLKYYKELAAERSESDRLLDTIVEKDNRIAQLESELTENKLKIEEMNKTLLIFKQDNTKLLETLELHSKCLKKEECEMLLNQIQELEMNLETQARDNKLLREENLKIKNDSNIGSLLYFAQDINKIKREMKKLVKVLEDLVNGKELSLKGLLGIENENKNDPGQQISNDIFNIKSDLNKIMCMISDFHAEQYANNLCKSQ